MGVVIGHTSKRSSKLLKQKNDENDRFIKLEAYIFIHVIYIYMYYIVYSYVIIYITGLYFNIIDL